LTCVFVKQSLGPFHCGQGGLHCTLHPLWHPLSRSYGASLPSSFSIILSRTLGFSPRLPVSDYDTVKKYTPLEAFLGSTSKQLTWPVKAAYPAVSRILNKEAGRICLPNILPTATGIHRPDASILCVPPSVITHISWSRNIHLVSISYAVWPRLRDRLTLGRRTLPRKS
jgi:hypothetical protein